MGAQSEAAGTITTARRVRWGDEFKAMWKHLGGQPDGSIVQTEDSGNVTTPADRSRSGTVASATTVGSPATSERSELPHANSAAMPVPRRDYPGSPVSSALDAQQQASHAARAAAETRRQKMVSATPTATPSQGQRTAAATPART